MDIQYIIYDHIPSRHIQNKLNIPQLLSLGMYWGWLSLYHAYLLLPGKTCYGKSCADRCTLAWISFLSHSSEFHMFSDLDV